MNEYDPEHDSNSCYFDNIEGKMVGGCENNSCPSIFINPGDIVQFYIDFELAVLTISVNSSSVSHCLPISFRFLPMSRTLFRIALILFFRVFSLPILDSRSVCCIASYNQEETWAMYWEVT